MFLFLQAKIHYNYTNISAAQCNWLLFHFFSWKFNNWSYVDYFLSLPKVHGVFLFSSILYIYPFLDISIHLSINLWSIFLKLAIYVFISITWNPWWNLISCHALLHKYTTTNTHTHSPTHTKTHVRKHTKIIIETWYWIESIRHQPCFPLVNWWCVLLLRKKIQKMTSLCGLMLLVWPVQKTDGGI